MISRDYTSILASLSSAGYLQSNPFSSPHKIIHLTTEDLDQAGLAYEGKIELFIFEDQGQYEIYEFEAKSSNLLGYGEEGSVYLGINLRTQESVAMKKGYGGYGLEGWKLAYEKLNNHPNFVHTYGCGDLYDSSGQAKVNPIVGKESIHIMEYVKGKRNLGDLQDMTSLPSQRLAFMEAMFDAADTMIEEGVGNFDYTSHKNILINEQGQLKLCDYNPVMKFKYNEKLKRGLYYETARWLHQIYTSHKYERLADGTRHPGSAAIYLAIVNFLQYIEEAKELPSRQELNKQLEQAIHDCEAGICFIDCTYGDSYSEKYRNYNQAKLACSSTCQIIGEFKEDENYQSLIQNNRGQSSALTFLSPTQCLDFRANENTLNSIATSDSINASLSAPSALVLGVAATYLTSRCLKNLMNWGSTFFAKKQSLTKPANESPKQVILQPT